MENRLQCVVNRYAELGGTEGRGAAGCPSVLSVLVRLKINYYICAILHLHMPLVYMCTGEARRLWSSSWSAVRAIDGSSRRLRYRLHSSKMTLSTSLTTIKHDELHLMTAYYSDVTPAAKLSLA